MNEQHIKSNITSSKHWLRLIFMLLFAAVLQVSSIIMWLLVVAQFIFSLLTGEGNIQLRKFGHALSIYIFDILKFLSCATDEKAFPLAEWPLTNEANIGAEKIGE